LLYIILTYDIYDSTGPIFFFLKKKHVQFDKYYRYHKIKKKVDMYQDLKKNKNLNLLTEIS